MGGSEFCSTLTRAPGASVPPPPRIKQSYQQGILKISYKRRASPYERPALHRAENGKKGAEALDKPGPYRLETRDHYEMSFYGCLNSR